MTSTAAAAASSSSPPPSSIHSSSSSMSHSHDGGVVSLWSLDRAPGIQGLVERGSFFSNPILSMQLFTHKCEEAIFANPMQVREEWWATSSWTTLHSIQLAFSTWLTQSSLSPAGLTGTPSLFFPLFFVLCQESVLAACGYNGSTKLPSLLIYDCLAPKTSALVCSITPAKLTEVHTDRPSAGVNSNAKPNTSPDPLYPSGESWGTVTSLCCDADPNRIYAGKSQAARTARCWAELGFS